MRNYAFSVYSYRSLQHAKKQFSEVNTTYKIYRFTKVTPLLVTKIPLSRCVLRTKLARIRHVHELLTRKYLQKDVYYTSIYSVALTSTYCTSVLST